jgi:ATPase subunit of ABC transporter with duplicated ATPase domains
MVVNISEKIDVSMGGKKLLIDTELIVSDKQHYGLFGVNGIGKTTLMNYIAKKHTLIYIL